MLLRTLAIASICSFLAVPVLALDPVGSGGAADAESSMTPCASVKVTAGRLNLNLDLQDYGRLFLDSGRPECASLAVSVLEAKLEAVSSEPGHLDEYGRWVGPFQGWLEGAHVSLIFATALQLGSRGEIDAALDEQLKRLRSLYRFAIDPNCGPNFGNGCMDDYAIAANAFAWIAAYEAKSGRESTARSAGEQSRRSIGEALSSRNHVCKVRHDDSLPVPCAALDRAVDGLASSYLEIVSFNHGFQNVAYGIGLLPSLSGAALGLEIAGQPWVATEENRVVADSLFLEGQRGAVADGSDFRSNCYRVQGDVLLRDSPCADALNKLPPSDPRYDPNFYYLPRMMAARIFFERLLGVAPNGDPWQFDEFDPALFGNPFLNEGRLATLGYLGYYWWNPAGSSMVRPSIAGFPRPARARPSRH